MGRCSLVAWQAIGSAATDLEGSEQGVGFSFSFFLSRAALGCTHLDVGIRDVVVQVGYVTAGREGRGGRPVAAGRGGSGAAAGRRQEVPTAEWVVPGGCKGRQQGGAAIAGCWRSSQGTAE